ncbi:MAG: phosphatase PAP2 family protein [Candidatus Cloacimonetes bacterium]|nr:phosphatase PAP2 family protein [Candidatus Cloacimonadota bacterium]
MSRRFFLYADYLIPVAVFVLTLFIFRLTNLDLSIQRFFYRADTGWYLRDLLLFRVLYKYGNLPALAISISGLILVWLSFQKEHWIKWRKIGAYLALVMILAPGLIINAVLKDHWGRPRPRNLTEFGGEHSYEKLLTIDKSSPGYSFPCGHASMGFYLFVPWFLLRRRKAQLTAVSLLTGIAFGTAIGIARIAQGGHFASDVAIAGVIVYLAGAGLFYLLKLDKDLWYQQKEETINPRRKHLASVVSTALIILIIAGVALATPYSKKGNHLSELYYKSEYETTKLHLNISNADLKVTPTQPLQISYETQGFGFPKSKLLTKFDEQVRSDTLFLDFSQSKKGFFTELDNKVILSYPFSGASKADITLNKGNASLTIPETFGKLNLRIMILDGNLDLDLPQTFKPVVEMKGSFDLNDRTGFNSSDGILINYNFKLTIIVVKGNVTLR